MGRDAPDPSSSSPAISFQGLLAGLVGLLQSLWAAWPELPEPLVEAGPRVGDRALPALRLRPPGAPEVVVAWRGPEPDEAALAGWLAALGGEAPVEVFLVEAGARPALGLRGYLLEAGRTTPIPPREGALESMSLGVLLRVEGGRLRVLQGQAPVAFPDELAAELGRARAEASRWRQRAERKEADATRQRAEAERQKLRAEHWKSEARRVRAALGEPVVGEEATAEIAIPPESKG